MPRHFRIISGLVPFVAIQAIGVVALSRNWAAAETPSDARLFLTIAAYMVFVGIACGVAGLIWGGNTPPTERPETPPPPPPPALSPAGIPMGPTTPKPLVAHATPAHAAGA